MYNYKYEFIKELNVSELSILMKELGLELNKRNVAIQKKSSNVVSIIDGEVWKDVKNYDGYQVSNLGRVKSKERIVYSKSGTARPVKEVILKNEINKGYHRVGLSKNNVIKRLKVHQMVAIAFLNHTPCGYKYVINHKNFIRSDNRVENLEIVTQRENANQKHIVSTSIYTGVCWAKKIEKWLSSIKVKGKKIHLGYFNSEKEASEYYEAAVLAINNNEPIKVKRIHKKHHSSLSVIITNQS
jgi:hypothetical protein